MAFARLNSPSTTGLEMHPYRTHTCGELRAGHVGLRVRLSGWVHRKRDHGHLLFVDLRDNFGITQGVIDVSSRVFPTLEGLDNESVVTLSGTVVRRSPGTVNPNIPTGDIELRIEEGAVLSTAEPLPRPANHDGGYPGDIPLPYPFPIGHG